MPLASDLGLDFLELPMVGAHDRSRVREEAAEINAFATTEGLDLVVQLPFRLDVASSHDTVRRAAKREYEAAIETAAAVGAERAVLRARTDAYRPAVDDAELRDRFVENVLDLDSYAAHAGVDLCVENRGDVLRLDEGFPRLFENGVSMCLNTALAHRAGYDAADQARLLADRDVVSHVHLLDRTGDDRPTPFGAGRIDFDRLLAPAGEDWTGTVALTAFDRGFADPAARADRLADALSGERTAPAPRT